jgi:hypothetical protein
MPQQLTADQKKAALQQRIAKLQQKVRRISKRERSQTERARTHAAIVVGMGMIEHAARNPASEVRRVSIRLCENWLATRPDDPAVADLLAQLQGAPSSSADDTEKLSAEAPSQTEAEAISDAAE